MTSYELTLFKKMVLVWKTKSLLFCLRYDPVIVFRRQNHITFIFIKTMSRGLLVQMAHSTWASTSFFLRLLTKGLVTNGGIDRLRKGTSFEFDPRFRSWKVVRFLKRYLNGCSCLSFRIYGLWKWWSGGCRRFSETKPHFRRYLG